MKKIIISLIASLCAGMCYSQKDVVWLLDEFQYNTQNNLIDIEKEFTDNLDPLIITNIYFRYYKNPKFLGSSFSPTQKQSLAPDRIYDHTYNKNKIMIFRVQYDYLIQTTVKSKDELNFQFRIKTEEDKIDILKLTYYRQENGKTILGKLSKKEFETIIDKNIITIKPKMKVLHENDVLRVLLSIQSSDVNIKDLSSINKMEGTDHFITVSIPELFKYNTDNAHLELLKIEESRMKLIKFYYDVSKLNDFHTVSSKTFFYVVKNDSKDAEILIPLNSIDLPLDIGTSESEIFNKEKK